MLIPMAKIEIIGPRGLFSDVLSLVHEQGRLHIEDLSNKINRGDVPLNRMELQPGVLKEREEMEDLLIRVRSILKALDRGSNTTHVSSKADYDRLYDLDPAELSGEVSLVIAEVEDRTASLAAEHAELESEMSLLARYEPILQKIQPLASQIVTTGQYDSVALLFERRYKGALDALKEELDRITQKQYEIVSTDVDEDTTAAILVFGRQHSDAVHKFLTMENVNQIRLPDAFEGMPFDSAYTEVRARRAAMPGEIEATRAELEKMSAAWASRLGAIRDVLIDRSAEIEAIPKFGRTEYAFVINGWMPCSDVSAFEKDVSARWKDDIIVSQLEMCERDYADTPVAFKNRPQVAPFQAMIGAYGMPRYGTLDPTIFLFIFFPLFFGMIVGDIAYGMINLSIVLWLRMKFKENQLVQGATAILGPAATMVIVFGFLYGEFFGNVLGTRYLDWIQTIQVGPVALPFDRVHAVETFMIVAVAVGVVHVILSLILGIVNAVRTKNRHHLWEKGGILTFVLAIGVVVLLAVVAQNYGSWAIWGQVLFALVAFGGFIFAVRGGGIMGVIETLEVFTGMASYIRIMAVGLAGAIFADAINEIVADMATNPAMIVVAIIIGVVLHTLNFIIATFSPAIHAARLNFLEFFRGFYESGGLKYSPFTKTGGEWIA
ncbi:MAG: V-type ATPase 116kDa subunit family protein [Coriobacteriia bacterium]|nr:V-type ATPase 116kDa subunit family protein [Coriobacteriia bacterium]